MMGFALLNPSYVYELSEKRSTAARAIFDKHEAEQRAARELAEAGPGIARPVRGREAW
jgi:hypothetical protein